MQLCIPNLYEIYGIISIGCCRVIQDYELDEAMDVAIDIGEKNVSLYVSLLLCLFRILHINLNFVIDKKMFFI